MKSTPGCRLEKERQVCTYVTSALLSDGGVGTASANQRIVSGTGQCVERNWPSSRSSHATKNDLPENEGQERVDTVALLALYTNVVRAKANLRVLTTQQCIPPGHDKPCTCAS
eukprot:jgi/Ulvmu1/10231/UM060_0032.1